MTTKLTKNQIQMEQTLNIVVEKNVYTAINEIAESEGLPLSILVRDLIKEALELREDALLAKFANDREKTFRDSIALTHEEAWQ